jgi:hypothetical protein
MSRSRAEIGRLIRCIGRLLADLDESRPDPVEIEDLRRLGYSLVAGIVHDAEQWHDGDGTASGRLGLA